MRRLALLLAALAVLLAGCGGSSDAKWRLWLTPGHKHLFSECVSKDCGRWTVTLNWVVPPFPNTTGYYVFLNGTQVGSATRSPHVFSGSDCGATNTLGVEAHDGSGNHGPLRTMSYTSPACSNGSAPTNTVAPYFSASTGGTSCTQGCAIVGEQIEVQPGSWTCAGGCGTLTYSYQWQDCKTTIGTTHAGGQNSPTTTGSCTNATGAGATTATYAASSSDTTACSGGSCSLVANVAAHNNGIAGTPTTISGTRCSEGEIPWTDPATGSTSVLSGPIVAGVGCSPISAQVGTTGSGERFCSNAPATCGYGDPLANSVGVPWGTSLTTVNGSLTLSSSGCAGLGSPSWCSGGGTQSNPWVINAVAMNNSGGDIGVSGGYWRVQNSQLLSTTGYNASVGGCCITFVRDTLAGTSNTNEPTIAVQVGPNNSTYSTQNGDYTYNIERIGNNAQVIENSYCYNNGNDSGAHHECWQGDPNSGQGAGANSGIVSTNNVMIMPWAETADFDGGTSASTLPAAAADVSSTNDLLIGGGGYNFYTGYTYACGTNNVTNDRFSRFYWPNSGHYGVEHNPGCPTMSWTGNIWDDTGIAVLDTGLGR